MKGCFCVLAMWGALENKKWQKDATKAGQAPAFLCLKVGNCCGCFFESAPRVRHREF